MVGETRTTTVNGKAISYGIAGEGMPVLLLHGFPQTQSAWRKVVPLLADRYQLIYPDLPGYGDSARLADGPEGFDKRDVARHLVDFMHQLGHEQFAVVGHDRGGLVAFRAALDYPKTVTHLAVLDILPTVDNWAALRGQAGVFAFHLFLLAQPTDLPERMITAAPDVFFEHFLDTWSQRPDAIDAATKEHYLETLRHPEAVLAICDDYRASAFIDNAQDVEDQRAGRKLAMPVLAAWQDPRETELPFNPQTIWASWADRLDTHAVSCGHFLPEEAPEELAAALGDLLDK